MEQKDTSKEHLTADRAEIFVKTEEMSKSARDTSHRNADLACVDGNKEDTVTVCCICCKILSCQTDKMGASDFGKTVVCSSMCLKFLNQTLAFMQGFTLCKLICVFVHQHRNVSRRNAETEKTSANISAALSSPAGECMTTWLPVPAEASPDVESTSCTKLSVGSSQPAEYSKTQKLTSFRVSDETNMSDSCTEEDLVSELGRRSFSNTIEKNIIDEEGAAAHSSGGAHGSDRISQFRAGRVNCGECGIGFKTRKSLKIHFNKSHRKQQDVKKKMACRICGKLCSGQVGLTLHIGNRHAGEKAAECEVCGERFFSSLTLHRHMTKIHNKPHGMCHICGKHFKYPHTLKEHIRAHTGIRGFVCELCGKSFLRLSNLCDHRRRDHGYGKQAKESVQDLSHAVKERKSGKPARSKLNVLQCRECRKTMENFQAWKTHMEEHKLNRSVFCQICGKSFKTQSSLYAHKKQHQEKRFQCDICSKMFTYKCNMERHRETHSDERPHKCEFCQKTFKTEIVLNRHKAMHIEDRQYKCHICGRGLTCTGNLKKHLRVMHPGSDTVV